MSEAPGINLSNVRILQSCGYRRYFKTFSIAAYFISRILAVHSVGLNFEPHIHQ